MSYRRVKRFISQMKSRGLSSRRIADELNFAGERHPKTRAPFDVYSVEQLVSEINRRG